MHSDHLGSIVAITNGSGAKEWINTYDEFGIPGDNHGRFQYTGQAWLAELGMYHYKARIYSPTLGRFLQTDPVGYADQLNHYAYVGNDPMNRRDPTGLTQVANTCSRVGGTSCSGSYGIASNNAASADKNGAPVGEGQDVSQGNVPNEKDPEDLPETPEQQLLVQTMSGGNGGHWTVRWILGRKSLRGGWIVQRVIMKDASGEVRHDRYEAWRVPAGSRFTEYYPDEEDDNFYTMIDRNETVWSRTKFYEGMTLPPEFKVDRESVSGPLMSTPYSRKVSDFLNSQPGTASVDRAWQR